MSKSEHRFTSDRLRSALDEAKYLKLRDESPYWMAMCSLDLVREHWDSDGSSEDEELKTEVDALLREDLDYFARIQEARDWEQ